MVRKGMTRTGIGAGLAVTVGLLLTPGFAHAATLSTNGSTLVYRATPGEKDSFYPTYRRNRDFYWVQADYPPFVTAGHSCSKGADSDRPHHTNDAGAPVTIVSCPAAGLGVADVQLGDGDDKMGIQRDEIYRTDGEDESALVPVHRIVVYADGGPGNDLIEGQVFADILFGGPGDDNISALGGNDLIRGGAGRDAGEGGLGSDRVYGGSGADSLAGVGGRDRIYGESGNDRINGGGFAFGKDRADSIYGGSGADTLTDSQNGKEFAGDRFSGGAGNDQIDDRDGNRDLIDCGAGRDSVIADSRDKVAGNCERVQRKFRPPGVR